MNDIYTLLFLHFAVSPTVTKLFIENQINGLEVDAGRRMTFECEAEGNPRPMVSVVGVLSGRVISNQSVPKSNTPYYSQLHFTRDIQCTDADMYACVADNVVASDRSISTIEVSTICKTFHLFLVLNAIKKECKNVET